MRHIKIILAAIIAIFSITACEEPKKPNPERVFSEGTRVGTVQKLSFKGDEEYRKTYEGILLLNGSLGAWNFSISPMDQATAAAVQAASDKQYPVRLYYKQYHGDAPVGAPTFQTEYRIWKVEPVTN